MKVLGKDLKEFWETIPEDYVVDGIADITPEDEIEIKDLKDDEKYELTELGFEIIEDPQGNTKSFAGAFKKWKAKQGKVNVLVSIEKEELEAALKTINSIKGVRVIR